MLRRMLYMIRRMLYSDKQSNYEYNLESEYAFSSEKNCTLLSPKKLQFLTITTKKEKTTNLKLL